MGRTKSRYDREDDLAALAEAIVLEITGIADIRTIANIHRRLLAALQKNPAVIVDLTRCTDADLCLLQTIEAARRYAATKNRQLSLTAPATGELSDRLKRGGFLRSDADYTFWLQSGEAA